MISPRAEIIDVGKRAGRKLLTQDEINSLLVSYAETRTTVVRLKGGDPSCLAAPEKNSKRCAARISRMKWFPASARHWAPPPPQEFRSPTAASLRKCYSARFHAARSAATWNGASSPPIPLWSCTCPGSDYREVADALARQRFAGRFAVRDRLARHQCRSSRSAGPASAACTR